MPFINTEYGSYNNYVAYFGNRSHRKFIVKLINIDLGTSEVLKINPSGITKLGKRHERNDTYYSFFTSITLDLIFSTQQYAGGSFLITAFNNRGVRSNVNAQIYLKNPATNDFDILYNGKINFEGESYNYFPNKNYVKCVLNEYGYQQTFLSRHELDLDITKNVSVDGTTITDVGKETITFNGIDIFLGSSASGIELNPNGSFSGVMVDSYFYGSIRDVLFEQSSGRINLNEPNGHIYVNDTDEVRAARLEYTIDYELTSIVQSGLGYGIEFAIEKSICNSADTILSTETILTLTNNNNGTQVDTGTINFVGDYVDVPVNGYMLLRARVTNLAGNNSLSLVITNNLSERIITVYEKSYSIGDTDVTCYNAIDALDKSIRLITGSNTAFTYTPSDFTPVINDMITSGFQLRNFYVKGITISAKTIFKEIDSKYPVTLQYNDTTNQFTLKRRSACYVNSQIMDIGEVAKITAIPSKTFNKILAGSIGDGKYEQDQGIFEYNVQHEYSTPFETANTYDIRGPINDDSIAMELTRRKPYFWSGVGDTAFDKTNFYVRTNGTQTIQNGTSYHGFEGIDQYYNGEINAKKSLVQHLPFIGGMFWKEPDNSAIRFLNNSKDIDISFPNTTLQESIEKEDFGLIFFDYMDYEIETFLTDAQILAFEANKHGYLKFSDKHGVNYFGFIQVLDSGIYGKNTKLTLKKKH
jgi:hypothetical protein